MKRLILTAAFLACALGLGPAASLAAPVVTNHSCPETEAICNGNLYGWAASHEGGNTWQIAIEILVTSNYTGNQWTDLVNAVHLKDFTDPWSGGARYSDATLVSAPTGTGNWTLTDLELNASGCAGGASGGVCIEWDGAGHGVGFQAGDILRWVFEFELGDADISSMAHLKYLYVTEDGVKVGDLGSFDIPGNGVPEPASVLLLGAGLFGMAWLRRRRERLA